jgi:hypothetical protein
LLCPEIMPLDEVRLLEARAVIGFWDYAAEQPELMAFYDSAMETWRPALMTGLQINACSCPHPNTPARQTAVLDDFLAGVRSRAVSS